MFRRYELRALVKTLIGLLIVVNLAHAQNVAPNESSFQPYEEITAFEKSRMSHLNRRVFFFVHFTCPFCRQTHAPVLEWSAGIPPGYEFEVIPAVGIKDHIPMAIGYYTVLTLAPERIENYQNALYRLIQDQGLSATSASTYVRAAKLIGIDAAVFAQAAQSRDVKTLVNRAYLLTEAYGLEEVPAVVLGNRFIAKPAAVQNQQEVFVTVLNGLFTMVYHGGRGT